MTSSRPAWRRLLLAGTAAAASVAICAGSAAAAEGPPLHASNMGICSSQLAHMGVRDYVNQLILDNRELFGSPGALYHLRAQENLGHAEPGVPQDKECVQR